MLLSLALIFLVGFSAAAIFNAIRLPRIIGMIATGIVLGPYVLDLLDPTILGISSQLRQMALIIILIRAGLTLNLADLKKVGRPAVMMSFVPACLEILGYFCFAPLLLGLSHIEALLMGAVLSAVSPAVVVPRMIQLIEDRRGTEKSIPQMILAGASCDDVFVIVLFSTFLTMAQGESAPLWHLVNIPVSIVLGVLIGTAAGFLLYLFFDITRKRSFRLNGSVKVIIMLSVAFLLMTAEGWLRRGVGSARGGCDGLPDKAEIPTIRVTEPVGNLRKALDRRRGAALCARRRCGRYPLHALGRSHGDRDDFHCSGVPHGRRDTMRARYSALREGEAVLCDRISSEGDGSGFDRSGAAVDGTALRQDYPLRRGARDTDHRPDGSDRHRRVPEAPVTTELMQKISAVACTAALYAFKL